MVRRTHAPGARHPRAARFLLLTSSWLLAPLVVILASACGSSSSSSVRSAGGAGSGAGGLAGSGAGGGNAPGGTGGAAGNTTGGAAGDAESLRDLAVSGVGGWQATSSAALALDLGSVVRRGTREAVGINVDYLVDDDSRLPAGGTALGRAMDRAGIGTLRYPGGDKSDNYLFTTKLDGSPVTPADTIDALRPDLVDPSLWPGGSISVGDGSELDFDEFMVIAQEQGITPVIVVPLDKAREIEGTSSAPTVAQLAASAGAWVKYANVTKGYGIKYWEVGNESYSNITAAAYTGYLKTFITAMKAEDPTIEIGAVAHDSAWNRAVLTAAASDLGFLSVHNYPIWQWSNYASFLSNSSPLTGSVDTAQADLTAAAGAHADRIFLAVTEYNAIDWGNYYGSRGWANVNDQGHALAVFTMLAQMLARPSVKLTHYWNTRWVDNTPFFPQGSAVAIENAGFESDLTSWNVTGPAAITAEAANVKEGTGALELAVSSPGTDQSFLWQTIDLEPGKGYTLRFWGRITQDVGWHGVGIDTFDSTGKKIEHRGGSAGILAGNYRLYESSFVVPPGTVRSDLWVYAGTLGPGSTTAYVDGIEVRAGTIPSINDALHPDGSFTATGYALALFGAFAEDALVRSVTSGAVTAYGATNEAGTAPVIYLVNKAEQATSVELSLTNAPALTTLGHWVLFGTSPLDFAPVFGRPSDVSIANGSLTVVVPPVSISVLATADP